MVEIPKCSATANRDEAWVSLFWEDQGCALSA
jgi:hypothetical protein